MTIGEKVGKSKAIAWGQIIPGLEIHQPVEAGSGWHWGAVRGF